MLICSLGLVGCQRDNRTVGPSGHSAISGEKSQTLLQSVANELASLPEQSIVDLQPPTILLDATKSADGQDVEAELTTLSTSASPVYNVLRVPDRNGRFKALGVRPGDVVKWYANRQSELESEFGSTVSRPSPEQLQEIMKLPPSQREAVAEAMFDQTEMEGDIVSVSAFEFKVQQVIDANTLMIDLTSLAQDELLRLPIGVPMRMEIIRFRDSRFSDLIIDLNRYARRGVPRLGWEPSPDRAATKQIVERLNRWMRQLNVDIDWQPPKLLATLRNELHDAPLLDPLIGIEALERNAFSLPSEELRAMQDESYEGRLLQEATWARDTGTWVTQDEFQTVARVERMFDWVVRNLQLDSEDQLLPPHRPWQSLVHGHATAAGRAWVFAQLCRQQDVPVVVVRPDGDDGPLWCGAVVSDEIYLFDPRMGLAIRTDSGEPAMLSAVLDNPGLLTAFDLPDRPYLAEDVRLDSVSVDVVAGPFAMTRRAAILEDRLTGDDTLLLRANVDALAERLQELRGVASVRLWSYPYEVLAAQLEANRTLRTLAAIEFESFVHKPQLWKARLLHFRGHRGQSVDASRGNIRSEIDDHRDAGRLYANEQVRPPDRTIDAQEADNVQRAWSAAKHNATYWLGLLSYDRGDHGVAMNWLEMAREAETWRPGATYNLARCHEDRGDTERAIELLRAGDGESPAGNQLRARLLSEEQLGSRSE